jgi:glycosyltransferase involved in cell wall biosynthesis
MSRVAMLVHSYFPRDPRVRKEAVTLAEAGHEVLVICLRDKGEAARDTHAGVAVRRLGVRRDRGGGRLSYLVEYAHFFAAAAVTVTRLDLASPFDVVHVHNIPDELVFAAAVPKLRGAGVVLDLHDPMPELFADKYGPKAGARLRPLLETLERESCRFADRVFVSSELCEARLTAAGIPPDRITVVLNAPEERRRDDTEPYVLMYHGSVFDRYGIDVVLEGVAAAAADVPGVQVHVYASDVDPRCMQRLRDAAASLGIADRVAFSGFVAQPALQQVMRSADAGLVPARRSGHMDIVYPTKLFDYLAAGLPVLAARTPTTGRLLEGTGAYLYEPDDAGSFARALAALYECDRTRGRAACAVPLPAEVTWAEMGARCRAVIEGLPRRGRGEPAERTVGG